MAKILLVIKFATAMSSRCLNAIKTCSKFKVNSKLLAQSNNIKIIKSTPYKINSSNYGTWGSLGKSHNNLKIIAAGVTGFGIYTSYQIYRKQSFLSSVVNPVFHVLALEEDNKKYRDYLNVEPTRKIRSSTDKSKYKLTFFQFQSCPFCCKVRNGNDDEEDYENNLSSTHNIFKSGKIYQYFYQECGPTWYRYEPSWTSMASLMTWSR